MLGKLENDELLYRSEAALHILQECISRTNSTVDYLDEHYGNELIEHASDPYRALMATIERTSTRRWCARRRA
jgi:hypothetical protein